MKRMHQAMTGLLLSLAAAAFPAHAALTRDDVRAALADARQSGELVGPGDSGQSLREQRPDLFPGTPASRPRTRTEVVAELHDAQRAGELMHGDSGTSDAELHPGAYPARVAPPGATREDVRAELIGAQRVGDIAAAGDSGLTLREQHPGWYARSAPSPLQVCALGAPSDAPVTP